jgi:hypothetical protein
MNMKVMRVSQIKSDLYCVPSSKFVFLRFFVQDEYVEVSLRLLLSAPIISRLTLSTAE